MRFHTRMRVMKQNNPSVTHKWCSFREVVDHVVSVVAGINYGEINNRAIEVLREIQI